MSDEAAMAVQSAIFGSATAVAHTDRGDIPARVTVRPDRVDLAFDQQADVVVYGVDITGEGGWEMRWDSAGPGPAIVARGNTMQLLPPNTASTPAASS